jgi:hypothetical protein
MKQSRAKFPPPDGRPGDWLPDSADFREVPGSSGKFPPESEVESEDEVEEKGKGSGAGKPRSTTLPDWLTGLTGFTPDLWAAWMDTRRRKRASTTPHAIGLLLRKLEQRPGDAIAAITMAVEAGWQGFEWDWFDNRRNGNRSSMDLGTGGL